jgi:hypothetical protein
MSFATLFSLTVKTAKKYDETGKVLGIPDN